MPEFSVSNTIAGFLFSSIGFVAFVYGKRMHCWTPMLCGIGLMMLPLFLTNLALLISSAVLSIAAIVFRHS